MLEDPYKTLGVAKDATHEQIRSAYRKLAKKHHPDLNPGNKPAEDRFKQVASAHDLLSDPEKRARFDRGEIDAAGQEHAPKPSYRDYADGNAGNRYGRSGAHPGGQAGGQPGGWSDEDFGDIFGSMFGEGAREGGGGGPRRGRDEHFAFTAAFLDAVNGATRTLTLGEGRTLDLKIPAGIADGQTLRLRGKGAPGRNGGPPGDALIEIHVAAHAFFVRDGATIRLDLPVTLTEAVLGGPIEVPTPAGPVRMRIPAAADTGTELRLRGRGVPAHGSQPAGDLYATLRVVLGKPDAALEEFLRAWTPEHKTNPRAKMEAGQ